jgi:hypothetical protein
MADKQKVFFWTKERKKSWDWCLCFTTCCLLLDSGYMLGLLFDLEDGNIHEFLPDYMVSHVRRQYYSMQFTFTTQQITLRDFCLHHGLTQSHFLTTTVISTLNKYYFLIFGHTYLFLYSNKSKPNGRLGSSFNLLYMIFLLHLQWEWGVCITVNWWWPLHHQKVTRCYFQHTSGTHILVGNWNTFTHEFSSVRLPAQDITDTVWFKE